MQKLSTLLLCCLIAVFGKAQTSTSYLVYELFQDKCTSCHGNANPEAGLDLEGSGGTEVERMLDVRNNIIGVQPANPFAAAKGYQYIYPGHADRSFLFHKINDGLEPSLSLEEDEGESMPFNGQETLTDEEKELIRQWIVFGAPAEGEVVDPQLLYDYYNVSGEAAFDTPPPGPAPGEGYQLRFGPYFMNRAGEEGAELEYYMKYDMELPENIEVNRVDLRISSYSHHIVVYRYTDQESADQIPAGLRVDTDHNNLNIVTTAQENAIVALPEGTAFMWDKDIVLDLNSHYINYSAGSVYKADAYINIYTQPEGTAAQPMETTLVPYPWIYIPNNSNTTSFSQEVVYPQEIYLWAIGGHTHQYGTDYKVWERKSTGEKGDLIYDASCSGGLPGCVSPYFDYQHIPVRTMQPLRRIDLGDGLIQEATYLNNGPEPVSWGSTSEDEMMLMGLMYVLDTTGLNLPIASSTSEVADQTLEGVSVHPNPMSLETTFTFSREGTAPFEVQVFDLLGNEIYYEKNITTHLHEMKRGELSTGMYLYRVADESGKWQSGKLFVD
ncbi:MAG: T9SS type A sorting domain-containing protein [Saprospiraceae bacterium]